MPPSPGDHDAIGDDAAFACHVLTGRVDIIEPAVFDRQDCGVADAAGLEAAEFRALHGGGGVDGRGGDYFGERHAEAQELRHGGDLSKAGPLMHSACTSDDMVSGAK